MRRHLSSARELADLLALVDRDVRDAQIEATSADRRLATAYNGALQLCRMKRNVAGYDRTGAVSESDVAELLELVDRLRADVTEWLDCHHPELRGAS
ncbi:MAG: hypothetical protein ACYC5Q_04130 [Thermoleophilia bacterium]